MKAHGLFYALYPSWWIKSSNYTCGCYGIVKVRWTSQHIQVVYLPCCRSIISHEYMCTSLQTILRVSTAFTTEGMVQFQCVGWAENFWYKFTDNNGTKEIASLPLKSSWNPCINFPQSITTRYHPLHQFFYSFCDYIEYLNLKSDVLF